MKKIPMHSSMHYFDNIWLSFQSIVYKCIQNWSKAPIGCYVWIVYILYIQYRDFTSTKGRPRKLAKPAISLVSKRLKTMGSLGTKP